MGLEFRRVPRDSPVEWRVSGRTVPWVHRCSGLVGTRCHELVSKSWGLREGYQEAMCDQRYRM